MNAHTSERPAAPARTVAFQLLQAWHESGRHCSELLDEALQQHPLSPEDRALTQELFYGVLRRKLYLDFLLDCFASRGRASLPESAQDILRLGAYQLLFLDQVPDYAVVDDACRLTRHFVSGKLVKGVNAILRRVQRQRLSLPEIPGSPDSPEHLSIKYSLPVWIVRRFLQMFGLQRTIALGKWAQARPPLTLRVNSQRTTRDALVSYLQRASVEARAHPTVPTAVVLESAPPIRQLPGFADGLWQVQDAASQCIAPLLDVQENCWVWDVCAAPGGKVLHAGELIGEKGRLYASDLNPHRLRPLLDNWRRLCARPLFLWAADGLAPALRPGALFDRILLDAPCTGLGVLSRRVDLRYKVKERDVFRLAELQLALLRSCASWLRVGGVLVYSTCTLTGEENKEVVDRFLDTEPKFRREPLSPQGDLWILPELGLQDGAFAAKLTRVS